MQVEHTAKQYVRTASTAPWGAPVDVCAPPHRGPLVCLSHHPGDTCGCVSVFPSQRRPPHNTGHCPLGVLPTTLHLAQVSYPPLSRPVPTSLDCCSIRIRVRVSQALHLPNCAGLRWWRVRCDGRNEVPSPVDTNPVLARHSPVSQVRGCGSPVLSSLSVNPSCLVSQCTFRSAQQ